MVLHYHQYSWHNKKHEYSWNHINRHGIYNSLVYEYITESNRYTVRNMLKFSIVEVEIHQFCSLYIHLLIQPKVSFAGICCEHFWR